MFVLALGCAACGGPTASAGATTDANAADAVQAGDVTPDAAVDVAAADAPGTDAAMVDAATDALPIDAADTPDPDATDADLPNLADAADADDALPDAGTDAETPDADAVLDAADATVDADAGPTPLGLNADVTLTSPVDGAVITVGATIAVTYALDVTPPTAEWTLTVELSNAATVVAQESLAELPVTHSIPVTVTQAGPQLLRLRIWQDGVLVAQKSVSLVGNFAPVGVPVLAVAPNPATAQADLQASLVTPSTDPDGNTLFWNWQWLLNGQPTTFVGTSVPKSWLQKGQKWTVVASATDGHVSGPAGQTDATIVNSVPTAVVLADGPTSVALTESVTATVLADATDADLDPLTTTWSWTWQGQEIATAQTVDVPTVLVNGAHLTPGPLLLTVTTSDGDGGVATVQRTYAIVAAPVCGTVWWTCAAHATCVDDATLTPPCTCDNGWQGDGKVCDDLNECDGTPCSANAKCQNSPGSFSCTCLAGFVGNGFTCSDVDECAEKPSTCSAFATCKNLPGSYSCTCLPGYGGDGTICSDLNECDLQTAKCDANATCSNSDGSFSCACNAGWLGNGFACSDVNECNDPALNACDAHADCLNSDGAYDCKCQAGWIGSGLSCADVDECKNGSAGCSTNATCANSPGGFACTCKDGYSDAGGDGKVCTDIDECKLGTAICDGNATCGNTDGAYVCACNAGYVGNGKSCAKLCDLYCAAITSNCVGGYQQYLDIATCQATCNTNAAWAYGQVGDTSGDSVACRYTQANSAAIAPASFCGAAGPTGGNTCGTWCDGYCDLMLHSCSGTYASATACQSACAAFPSNGAIGVTTGDSVQCRSTYAMSASCSDAGAVSKKCASSIDISGWKLSQTTSTQSFTVPAGTTVAQGGYLIISRASARSDFEAFWGVTLGANVTFLPSAATAGSTTACPQINGDETYTVTRADLSNIESATIAMPANGKFVVSRSDPTQNAGVSTAWTQLDYTVKSNATPGSGQTPGLVNGPYISEFADASGTNNFVYEYVEVFFDPGP
jgi:hypothetical protein